MSQNSSQDYSGLRWIRSEIDETLRLARHQLEDFVEGEADSLKECIAYLHHIHGSLEVVQVYGAAMLADEMEALTIALDEDRVTRKEAAAEVLMLGMIQLPAYLEKIESGKPDIPLILLPLMNDLRASREASLVSEISLFAPKLNSVIANEKVIEGTGSKELIRAIRKQRKAFHRGLLNWYRDVDSVQGLSQIRDVIERVLAEAGTLRMRRLLDSSEALVVAMQEGSVDSSVAVKLIFGQLDRLFKQVINEGEEAAANNFPLELLKNQLYYIASAKSENPVVMSVQRSADLANSFPDVDDDTSSLGGPGKELFDAVGDALRSDLREVKDQLDLYMRGDRSSNEQLNTLVDPIRRIADTLGMIGRGELRSYLKPHCDRIASLAQNIAPADDEMLMSLASDLLFVESALSDLAKGVMTNENDEVVVRTLSEGEFQEHVQVTIDQAFIELAKSKDALLRYLAEPDKTAFLESVPANLHIVEGALIILNQEAAAGLLIDFRFYIEQLIQQKLDAPNAVQREALADLVSGVEYHMEAVAEQNKGSVDALAFAEEAAGRLGLREIEIKNIDEVEVTESITMIELEAVAEIEQKVISAEKPSLQDIDPEILEIFTEEVREEIDEIIEHYPKWRDSEENIESLKIIRRSFHTIKGSGRLVGAKKLGDFSWSIENLLNRIVDGSLQTSIDIHELIDAVIVILPSLIDEFENPNSNHVVLVSELQEKAESLLHVKVPVASLSVVNEETIQDIESDLIELPNDELLLEPLSDIDEDDDLGDLDLDADSSLLSDLSINDTSTLVSMLHDDQDVEVFDEGSFDEIDRVDESILTPESEIAAPIELESSLHDIFNAEAATHLITIESFIGGCRGLANGCLFNDDLKRALHTLRGSAHMAQVASIAALSGAMEAWVNAAAQRDLRTDPSSIDLLERGHFVMNALLSVINKAGANLPAWQALQKEFHELTHKLKKGSEFNDSESELTSIATLDKEIVEIFLEEANELSTELEQQLENWQQRPQDLLPVAQLQRALHTIKGGARLAGVTPIGDLSHAMESVFESVVEQRIEGDASIRGLSRHAMDLLASQIERLESGENLVQPQSMVDRLEAASKGKIWHSVEPVPDASTLLSDGELSTELNTSLIEETLPVVDGNVSLGLVDESTFLMDSQLLADSELLSDSSFAVSSLLLDGSLDSVIGTILHDDSRIIKFPTKDNTDSETEKFVRRAPPLEEEQAINSSQERVRVESSLLDSMVNHAGEVSIYRARLEQQNKTLAYNLDELSGTIERLFNQLRGMEIETETQILSRYERDFEGKTPEGFDPLEMDRYSTIQQLSRGLSETVNDLGNIGSSLNELNRDTDTLLLQQERVTNDLQDGLLRTRMVPFASRTARLQRVVRQTSHSLNKKAELSVVGGDGEMDRAILERMIAPIEHLLRNAVAHGIESTDERTKSGKPQEGVVTLTMEREGSDVLISVSDDGRGLNRAMIREKAIERELLGENDDIDDDDLDQFILEPGFSTEYAVSQISGRGVGMDVALSEVKQLGGTLDISSQPGLGTSFNIRLPFTLAITEALLVQSGEDIYAVPHNSMDGVVRISREDLEANYNGEAPYFHYDDRDYEVRYLGSMLGSHAPVLPENQRWFPVLLVRSGEHRVAVHVNALLGNRQIVAKTIGVQLSSVRWFTGGTILADGQIALILDMNSLVRMDSAHYHPMVEKQEDAVRSVKVMVVDDSITVRKVTSRLLERHNMEVVTAKDGIDAIALLQDESPDVMLLDIEMPRMDGFELARHMRSSDQLSHIPIIMITSRSGNKHQAHAMQLGVKRYLGKPYQEADLLENIYTVLAETTDE